MFAVNVVAPETTVDDPVESERVLAEVAIGMVSLDKVTVPLLSLVSVTPALIIEAPKLTLPPPLIL